MSLNEIERVIASMLETSLKLSLERERIRGIFTRTGILVSDEFGVTGVKKDHDPLMVLRELMDNLSEMPVLKIASKQILRKSGINI